LEVRPGAYPRVEHLKVLHSGRLRKSVNYGRKNFYSTGPSTIKKEVGLKTSILFQKNILQSADTILKLILKRKVYTKVIKMPRWKAWV
jgi:hypothetical protein